MGFQTSASLSSHVLKCFRQCSFTPQTCCRERSFAPATHHFLQGIYPQLRGAWHKGKRLLEFALGAEQSRWLTETVPCLAKIHGNGTWNALSYFSCTVLLLPATGSCCLSTQQRKAGACSSCRFKPRSSNLMPSTAMHIVHYHYLQQSGMQGCLLASSRAGGQCRKLTGVDGHASVWPLDTHQYDDIQCSGKHP